MKYKKRFLLVFILFLCMLTGVLSVRQLEWLNSSVEQELQTMQKGLLLEASEFIFAFRDAVNLIFRDFAGMSDDEKLFLFSFSAKIDNKEVFLPTELPEGASWLHEYASRSVLKTGYVQTQEFVDLLLRSGYFIVASQEQLRNYAENTPIEVSVFALDWYEFFNQNFQAFSTSILSNLSYSVSYTQEAVFYSTDNLVLREADLIIPLDPFLSFGSFLFHERPNIRRFDRGAQSHETMATTYRFLLDNVLGRQTNNTAALLTLNLFFEEDILRRSIEQRKQLNTILSVGTLFILIATMLMFYIMYNRLLEQRKQQIDFVAAVSHDLRTPLTVIRSAAQNLAGAVVKDERKVQKYGSELLLQADKLSRMLESVWLYSGLLSFENLKTEKLHLQEFCAEVLSSLEAFAESKGTYFHVKYINVDCIVNLDSRALQSIIENLVANAIIHGKKANSSPIHIYFERTPVNSFLIRISDNGPGIPASEQKKIFQAFYRGRQSIEEQHAGTGLGLHLVSTIAKKMGGKVSVESPYKTELGTISKGTHIIVEIPLGEIYG